MAQEFRTPSGPLRIFPMSSYFLGYTLGLLLIPPFSETLGRVGMLQTSNMIFIIFNTAAGFCQNNQQVIIMRALSGFGGSGPLSLGGGILNDCFTPEERTSMITVYTLPGQLSPALGPILGALTEKYLSWRWTFWIVSIVSVVAQSLCFLIVRETYKPVLVRRSQRQAREREEGLTTRSAQITEELRRLIRELRTAIPRPFKMLATHPIVELLALYNAVAAGLQYLVISSLDDLWKGPLYRQGQFRASLNYWSFALGMLAGAQICRPLNKWVYRKLKSRDPEGQGRPEYRVPMIAVGTVALPIGLLWYGWSAQIALFPLVPNLGVSVFAVGIVIVLMCTSLYVVDAYQQESASATGAVNVLRTLGAFAFPLFSDRVYRALGYGWGNTILAGLSIGIGLPLSFVLWRSGRRMRGRGMV
ncbi:MAG: hypothetical protein Q9160_004858 [Pyrenula sp. 1 TL-2023]